MKLFYKLFILPVGLCMLAWGITSLSDYMRGKGTFVPFTLYSEVAGTFASFSPGEQEGLRYFDHKGHTYTETQFDSILPSFYARQLVMDGRFPDSIRGRAVTPQWLEEESFIFISHPSSLNAHTTPLYSLLESRGKRVNLEMPPDVFRFTQKGIEFVNMERNKLDEQKTKLFQKVLRAKGVQMPIRLVAGNPTTRKAYDNGYLIVDGNNRLFHLKQVVGRPFVRAIELPDGVVPATLFVTEYSATRHLGFVVDKSGDFYALRLPDYHLVKAELPPLDMRSEKVTIFGNAFFWTVVQSNEKGVTYTALDAHRLTQTDHLYFPTERPKGIADYLLPLQLRFTSSRHEYFRPALSNFSPIGLTLWLLFIALATYLRRRQQR